MLNLAGVDLVVDPPDRPAEKFIEEYISTRSYLPWLRPSNPPQGSPGITFAWPRAEPDFRLNRLVWPQSASRWAYGHFLATSDQLKDIQDATYGEGGVYTPIPLKIGTPDIADQVTGGSRTDNQIEAQVYLLPPTPLSGIRNLTGEVCSLYLISVVDIRFLWYQNSTGTITIYETTTWNNLYTNLAAAIGLGSDQFEWDAIPSEYLQPSPNMFTLNYQPFGFALDAVAFNVGQRIVANYDGSFAAKNATNSLTDLLADFTPNRPTRLVIAGGPRLDDTGTPIFASSKEPAYLNIGSVNISFGCRDNVYVSTFDNPSAPGAFEELAFTDSASICGPSSLPTNKSELDDLTSQFGGDFLQWLSTQFDYVFAGIVDVEPNGYIDQIEFDMSGHMSKTRIMSMPLNGWPTELGHQDPGCPSAPPGGLMLGVATTDIQAASGTTYGTGMFQPYSAGSTSATTLGSPIAINNWFPTKILSGANLIAGNIGCRLFVISAAC